MHHKHLKILLVFPPSTIYAGDPTKPAVVFPLGLAYLASYIRQYDFEVRVIDGVSPYISQETHGDGSITYGITDEQWQGELESWQPDVVGISCMYTAYAGDVHRLAAQVKTWNPTCLVVIGGAHASTFPELTMRDRNIDVVVVGEGESPLLEILSRLRDSSRLEAVEGAWVRTLDGVEPAGKRSYLDDLDVIPWPAWDLFNMNIYIDPPNDDAFAMRKKQMTMVTSRGCPGQCIYCTINSVWGRKWRGRSPESVVAEIEHLHQNYGVEEFYFMDDSAGASRVRLEGICDLIIDRGLDIRWTTPNGIAHWTLNTETLDKMKRAGCYRITFGIESGNPEIRDYIGKRHSLDQAKAMLDHANRIGMWTICTFIMGFPQETRAQMEDTVDFAISSGADLAVFYLLCPHPGTKVYEDFNALGLLDFSDILDPMTELKETEFGRIGRALAGRGVGTTLVSAEDLRTHLNDSYRRWFRHRLFGYANPIHILRKIRSVEDLHYTWRIGSRMAKTMLETAKSGFFSQTYRRPDA